MESLGAENMGFFLSFFFFVFSSSDNMKEKTLSHYRELLTDRINLVTLTSDPSLVFLPGELMNFKSTIQLLQYGLFSGGMAQNLRHLECNTWFSHCLFYSVL